MKNNIKVLFCVRSDFFTKIGGDTILVNSYMEDLRQKGVVCDATVEFDGFSLDYDIFHIINLDRPLETYIQLKYIFRHLQKPIIFITPIHHDVDQIYRMNKSSDISFIRLLWKIVNSYNAIELLKNIVRIFRLKTTFARKISYLFHQRISCTVQQRFIMNHVDKILLVSDYEKFLIEKDLNIKVDAKKCTNVPNGINSELINNIHIPDEREGILFVARIESRKNQLALLNIADKVPYHITFVGQANPNQQKYYAKFISKVNSIDNVSYIPGLPQKDLFEMIAKSKLHILASYVEVSPLIDTAVIALGCNVITTVNSSVKGEFQNENVIYLDFTEITPEIIVEMYNKETNESLMTRVRREYDSKAISDKLFSLYTEELTCIYGAK